MTDHIVSFSVGIDDDKIVDFIQKNAAKQIINDIRMAAMNEIYENRWSYKKNGVKLDGHDKIIIDADSVLSDFAKDIIKECFAECREEIISRAAKELAASLKRTKAWKEAANDILKEE